MKVQVTVCLIVICALVLSASARPKDNHKPPKATLSDIDRSEYGDLSDETILKVKQCENDMDKMELCMRCAKETKSELVYPLCCADEDDVQGWCHEYIFFGRQ
ncbi:hypothetical protein ACFFRR_007555 [Megaselia abdita]